jgi:Ca2+-binding EF-hand superfamily protein
VAIITKQAVTVSEEEQLREVFKVFDRNGEGFITAPKLKEVLAVRGGGL